jgi:hypothetical protein
MNISRFVILNCGFMVLWFLWFDVSTHILLDLICFESEFQDKTLVYRTIGAACDNR